MTNGFGQAPLPSHGAAVALALGLLLAVGAPSAPAEASGEALLLIEADTGKVLKAENATYPWYPASVTKLMTAYLTLRAVKEGRIALDTLLTVSPNAVAQQPTKMGFRTGTQVTVDNALKMLMVKSANDIAVVLAEGISGSVEKFADEMNRASARLGMVQSSWVNPNGLPADDQVTSARDMAILARAVLAEFPEQVGYWNIQAIRLGKRVMRNTNSLIFRYPDADGMKTGFICASGFNVVATATRGNRRLIAVVLGAPSSAVRAAKAASLFENAFNSTGLSWLMPSFGTVYQMQPINAAPPNLREAMCGKHRKRPAAEAADDEDEASGSETPGSVLLGPAAARPSALVSNTIIHGPPVEVFVGPPRPPRDPALAIAAKNPAAATPLAAKARRPKPAAGVELLAKRPEPAEAASTARTRTASQKRAKKTVKRATAASSAVESSPPATRKSKPSPAAKSSAASKSTAAKAATTPKASGAAKSSEP